MSSRNPFGFPPRNWSYLVSLELSEVLGRHVCGRGDAAQRAAAERFAEEAWRLAGRLDRFARARTTRKLADLRAEVERVQQHAAQLAIGATARALVDEKLAAISEALAAVGAIEERAGAVVH